MPPKMHPFPTDLIEMLARDETGCLVPAMRMETDAALVFKAFDFQHAVPSQPGIPHFIEGSTPGLAIEQDGGLKNFKPAHILIDPSVHRTAPWDGGFRALSLMRYDKRYNPGLQDRESGRIFCNHDFVFYDPDEAFHTARILPSKGTRIGDPVRIAGAIPEPDEVGWQWSWTSALAARIDEEMNRRLDYAETHKDAGDAYTHLPREGMWSHGNGEERLKAWMSENEIDMKSLPIDEISDLVLDNFRMEPGSIHDPTYIYPDLFLVSSFPVTEIEEQISKDDIMPTASDADWEAAKKASSFHFSDSGLAYATSSRVWYAVINRDDLEQLIAERALEAVPDIDHGAGLFP